MWKHKLQRFIYKRGLSPTGLRRDKKLSFGYKTILVDGPGRTTDCPQQRASIEEEAALVSSYNIFFRVLEQKITPRVNIILFFCYYVIIL